MSDNKKYSFLKETVKDEQITGKRIIRGVIRTLGKGFLFGLAACLAFFVLKPWLESDKPAQTEEVNIPMDELNEEQGTEEEIKLTAENYREMNEALNEVALEARKTIVEIRAKNQGDDWKEEEQTKPSISGVIVWNSGSNLLILAPKDQFKREEEVLIGFTNGKEFEGVLKVVDRNHGLGIYTVSHSKLDKATQGYIKVAMLGNSYVLKKGTPVIAMGTQFGYSDGMGYGVISSLKNTFSIADYKYTLITTDITASSQGSGVLFNIDGQVVGIIDQKRTDTTQANLVSAFAISELKGVVEMLSNGNKVPYLGVVGVEVTEEISEKEGIPMGIYVKEVEAESPAMQAGIQCGDIVVKMNDVDVLTRKGYSNKLINQMVGMNVRIEVMRLGAEEYEMIRIDAVVGSK